MHLFCMIIVNQDSQHLGCVEKDGLDHGVKYLRRGLSRHLAQLVAGSRDVKEGFFPLTANCIAASLAFMVVVKVKPR